jgi:putative membrane protein
MMLYYGGGMGAGGWIVMSIIAFGFVALLALGAAAVLRPVVKTQPAVPSPLPEAERVLADRFARGDIDVEEYEQRLRILRSSRM